MSGRMFRQPERQAAPVISLYICTCCGYIHLSQHGTKLVSEHEIKA